jgi:hypothetical protein
VASEMVQELDVIVVQHVPPFIPRPRLHSQRWSRIFAQGVKWISA